MVIQQNIPLAPLTTIQLGGNTKKYVACITDKDIIAALSYAKEKNLRVHVLGGGSNTIFSDSGFDGLVIHMQTKGMSTQTDKESTLLTAKAGEEWDSVVQYAISNNLTGIECLSGIPGSCGGTPFQNVGAYGQEVGQTIHYVDAIDSTTLQSVRFTNKECNFAYRTSRFKENDKDKYIITSVTFRLTENGIPNIRYGELHDVVGDSIEPGIAGLTRIRTAVLSLRKKKSMLVDPNNPNSISCGSFFTNPIISVSKLADIQKNIPEQIPSYDLPAEASIEGWVKLSAAWLVEHSGFAKGTMKGNVGISEHHSLALINKGGTTTELLAFAKEIQEKVQATFNINLALEPLVIP